MSPERLKHRHTLQELYRKSHRTHPSGRRFINTKKSAYIHHLDREHWIIQSHISLLYPDTTRSFYSLDTRTTYKLTTYEKPQTLVATYCNRFFMRNLLRSMFSFEHICLTVMEKLSTHDDNF